MTVLLLEDHDQVRSSIVAMLADLGYSSCARGRADQLGDLLKAASPSLLIVDVILGQADGILLANEVLAVHPGLPVIAISGADQPRCIERLSGAGECLFLLKPFGLNELQSALSQLISPAHSD